MGGGRGGRTFQKAFSKLELYTEIEDLHYSRDIFLDRNI